MKLAHGLIVATIIVLMSCVPPRHAAAGDWPQILGPQRNGVAEGETLPKLWASPDGPKVAWKKSVGRGLAGVAVSKGSTYLFHREGDQEVLESLDALTGESHWKAAWATDYDGSISDDDGPRCVPVVDGEHVYVLGAAEGLACVRTKDGGVVWNKNIVTEYACGLGYFGVGSTPILEKGVLIVNVGGQKEQAGVVGFDALTGKQLWKSVADAASYSSPVATTVGGVRHVLCITRLKLVSLDPTNGKVRFEFPFGQRGPTVNGASPLVINGHVLVTASYGIGATFSKIGADRADAVWSDDLILSSQYSTPVFHNGYVFALDGREDVGKASVRCFDPFKKAVTWDQPDFGVATPILVGDKIVLMKSDGKLVVIAANPKKFQPLAEATLFQTTTRALPAFANGLLYVRDTKTLKCLDLRAN